jgi:predicted nucleic acid-binding protein
MLCFVDTNILVYWLQNPDPTDSDWVRKNDVAAKLIRRLGAAKQIVLSSQVQSEFFNVVTRRGKVPLTLEEAAEAVDLLGKFPVVPVDSRIVQLAARRTKRNQLNYWDALIVEAALKAEAKILYTEDLQDGMRFDSLEVCNPFLV